jgi:hypothetical protein
LALAFVFGQSEYIAMNTDKEAEEKEVDEQQEGKVITAIREALSESIIIVSQNDDQDYLFSDIDSFVKLSQGNTSITNVILYAFDKEGDDTLWHKMGKGLSNLKSLEHFNIDFEEETNTDEPTPRPDFRTLAIVLPHLRQEFALSIGGRDVSDGDFSREEVKALARAIRRHPTIKEFITGPDFSVDTFHILLSALATLPSLQAATLGLENLQGSHFEKPEALKELLLSPSLRKICFDHCTFSGPLCRALEEALQEESNVAWLSLEDCSFLAGVSGLVARVLEQNTTLTTFDLQGEFPKEFYDAFAVALLINTTLTDVELNIPDDESRAALLVPVFLALGMNKALKKLKIWHNASSAIPVYLAIRDGLVKNSTLEMLHVRTFNTEQFAISLLPILLPFLRVSTTLKSLKIEIGYHSARRDPHVTTSCLTIATALRENLSLGTLEISGHGGIVPDTYIAALENVQMNTTLKKLHLSPMVDSFGNDEMKRVVSLVKKKYVLTELDKVVTEKDETGELHSILRLNQEGRSYLIDDAGSISKGVEVLVDVRDDLGCLFYHLLENPLLCDIEQQPVVPVAKGGSRGSKRIQSD